MHLVGFVIRRRRLNCKSLGLTWPCRTAVVRPVITDIHKGLLLCISVMTGLVMAVRLKHVAINVFTTQQLCPFLFTVQNIGMTVRNVYLFNL